MSYFNMGLYAGYNRNPYSYGTNPFANQNNPYLGYDMAYAPISRSGFNLMPYGYVPYSNYNFLNSSPSSASATGFNGGRTAFNSGFTGFNPTGLSAGNLGGYGSFDSYNFLNSTPSVLPSQNFSSFNPQQYTTNPYSTINQTVQATVNNPSTPIQSEKTTDTKSLKGKTISTGNGYGPEFLAKVKRIAQNLNCDYKDLLAVMNAESGIKTTAVNKSTNATGLIQFMPKTAQGLGTSVDQLKRMTPLKQLDYVEKYLAQTKRQAGFSADKKLSGGELYALVFRPAKAKTGIFATRGEAAYKLNAGLDLNKDGYVTMRELSKRVENFYVSDNSFIA